MANLLNSRFYTSPKRERREVDTGQERLRFGKEPSWIRCLAFSPDGRKIVTGNDDSTGMVWDLTGGLTKGRLAGAEIPLQKWERLWADLAKRDGQQAYHALWRMVSSPKQTTVQMKLRLRPITADDLRDVPRLIRDLDANVFRVREKAERQLAVLGEIVELELRKALTDTPSPEARRRMEHLLERVAGAGPSPMRQALRAIEVLEQIATPDACRLLKKLASGTPAAQLTQRARVALDRLKRQPGGLPTVAPR
jgi:hypothetical protein